MSQCNMLHMVVFHANLSGGHLEDVTFRGYNFKTLFCTPTFLSLQFFHLSIYIFFTHCLSAKITNKFESNKIRIYNCLYVETGELEGFRYVSEQDRVLKLYPCIFIPIQQKVPGSRMKIGFTTNLPPLHSEKAVLLETASPTCFALLLRSFIMKKKMTLCA